MKKVTIEDVREFVENNSDCMLISEEYNGQLVPLSMICGCGKPFEVTFKAFKRPLDAEHNKGKRWCNTCGQKRSNADRTYTIEQIREMALKNNCILVSTDYTNCKKCLTFICACGEPFEATWDSFVNKEKRQCNPCGQILNNLPTKKTNEQFLQEVYDMVCDEYTPISKYNQANEHITMKHNICDFEYPVTPDKFLNGQRRCPKCSDARNSKLSRAVEYWLQENHFKYEREYIIDECRNKKVLPFDFAILNGDGSLKLLIEVDGEQHAKPARFSKDKERMLQKFREVIFRDQIKTTFCEVNNIPLLRIKHNEMRKFKKKIRETLHVLKDA
ncbi:PDDEXK family nuclease [Niallia taxi]|uniref:hypothetical protein n=1 Tax=Niallia taxi TaxID=2499688 RepID=UPI0015F4CFE5|nr:hypothetical protein [Niallia taxi]